MAPKVLIQTKVQIKNVKKREKEEEEIYFKK